MSFLAFTKHTKTRNSIKETTNGFILFFFKHPYHQDIAKPQKTKSIGAIGSLYLERTKNKIVADEYAKRKNRSNKTPFLFQDKIAPRSPKGTINPKSMINGSLKTEERLFTHS